MTACPWLIAVTAPNCESRATRGLTDLGLEVWWPVRMVEIRIGRKREKQTRAFPAFPGYLFVRPRPGQSWHAMLKVDGVRAVLCDPSTFVPYQVSDDEVQRVRIELGPLAEPAVKSRMPIGTAVSIMDGPLLGLRGLLTAIMSNGAAQVAVDVLGRSTSLQIDYTKLEAAP